LFFYYSVIFQLSLGPNVVSKEGEVLDINKRGEMWGDLGDKAENA
jgi:hypothetical protein